MAAAAQAPDSDAATPTDVFTGSSRPQSKASGFCKHHAPKCQAGQCKHVCCHTRAQAQGNLSAKWANPLFTQDDADMAGGSCSVFGAAPVYRKQSGAAAQSDKFREMIEDELVISQSQLGSKRYVRGRTRRARMSSMFPPDILFLFSPVSCCLLSLRLGSSSVSSSNAGAFYESEAARSVARDSAMLQRQTQHIAPQHQSSQMYAHPQQQQPFGYGPSLLAADAAIPQVEWPAVDPEATPQLGGGGSSDAYLRSLVTPVRRPEASSAHHDQWSAVFEEEEPDKAREAPTPAQVALKKRKCPIGH